MECRFIRKRNLDGRNNSEVKHWSVRNVLLHEIVENKMTEQTSQWRSATTCRKGNHGNVSFVEETGE